MAVMILLLATSVLVSAVSLGVRHYISSLSGSEANVLASTIESVMTDELAYTTEIHTDGSGKVTSFQSQHYAVDASLSTFFIAGADDQGYGELVIGTADDAIKVLGHGSYPNDLGVKIEPITYTGSTFTITISIGRNGSEVLARTFQVMNVNRTVPQV